MRRLLVVSAVALTLTACASSPPRAQRSERDNCTCRTTLATTPGSLERRLCRGSRTTRGSVWMCLSRSRWLRYLLYDCLHSRSGTRIGYRQGSQVCEARSGPLPATTSAAAQT